jgi:hypothetical protein
LGTRQTSKTWGGKNGPLFDGKQLKPVEFQLIVYDFKVCILAQPHLTDSHGRILKIWSGLRRNHTRTAGSGRGGFDLWRFVEERGRGDMIEDDVRARVSNGGEEETGDWNGGMWNGVGRIVERRHDIGGESERKRNRR